MSLLKDIFSGKMFLTKLERNIKHRIKSIEYKTKTRNIKMRIKNTGNQKFLENEKSNFFLKKSTKKLKSTPKIPLRTRLAKLKRKKHITYKKSHILNIHQ